VATEPPVVLHNRNLIYWTATCNDLHDSNARVQ